MISIAMTPAQFAAKSAELQSEYGIVLPPGKSGTISHDGATVQYTYNGEVFMANVLKKPFFISTAAAEEKLAAFLTPEAT